VPTAIADHLVTGSGVWIHGLVEEYPRGSGQRQVRMTPTSYAISSRSIVSGLQRREGSQYLFRLPMRGQGRACKWHRTPSHRL
jgi:hypothetical protein